MAEKVLVPVDLVDKFRRAASAFHELEECLEDFLIARDPRLLKKLLRARGDHLAGKTRSLDEVMADEE